MKCINNDEWRTAVKKRNEARNDFHVNSVYGNNHDPMISVKLSDL